MALIVCPECQKEVSDQAAACPACGYPIHKVVELETPAQQAPAVVTVRKSRGVYIVLGLLFGMLGIHNFYAGYHGYGAAQLICNVLLFWTIFVPVIVFLSVIWDLVSTTHDASALQMA